MNQVERYVKTGRSQQGIGATTLIGALLDDKKSKRAVNRWFFNSGQRTYSRKQIVWLCDDCAGGKRKEKTQWSDRSAKIVGYIVGYSVLAILALSVLSVFFDNETLDEKNTSADNNPFENQASSNTRSTPDYYYSVSGVASNDVLNIRTEPSPRARIIGTLEHDQTKIKVVGIDPNSRWVLIEFDSGTGWVHGAYLEPN